MLKNGHHTDREVYAMPRETKADPSTIGLGSADVEGQGTTTKETGKMKMDSSRRKNRKKSGIL